MKILVIGGTRYFGKRLVEMLIREKEDVVLLTRGKTGDPFGNKVLRLHADRKHEHELEQAVGDTYWDVIVDQRCMNAWEAQSAARIFEGRVKHYVATSSMSVYELGARQAESEFQPEAHLLKERVDEFQDYAEAKRQMESTFATSAKFPICFPRFPMVLGPDDYTGRLMWHVERVFQGRPINMPGLGAHMVFISSLDAARALHWCIRHKIQGPINFASKEAISMREILGRIEVATGRKAVLGPEGETSPFGIESDWSMDMTYADKLGFRADPLDSWFNSLISEFASAAHNKHPGPGI